MYIYSLEFDDGYMCVYLRMVFSKFIKIAYFKYIQFLLCQLYLKAKVLKITENYDYRLN